MKKLKKPVIFTLALLPIAALAGYFTTLYQLEMYDQAMLETLIAQIGSLELLTVVTVAQTVLYAAFSGFIGYLLADRLGLMKPLRFQKSALTQTCVLCVIAGILFSLDYWIFGAVIPGLQEGTLAGMTVYGWIASILYGGIIEELLLRLFMMSLIAWLIWKIFLRKEATVPTGVLIAANILASLLFAAGHLPATLMLYGTLSPILLIRCFLFNGGFGLLFGWMYRKHGIHYAMVSHALLHIISKLIWTVFA